MVEIRAALNMIATILKSKIVILDSNKKFNSI